MSDEKRKPGLLVEDANAIEIEHKDGTQEINKTADREAEADRLRESKVDKPVHG